MHFEPPRHTSDDERILPLINVVFLLLIFFMLAGTMAASDPFEVTPPVSASEGPDESDDLLVLVGADGRLALDGESLDDVAFQAALTDRLEDAREAGRPVRVRLKADGQAPATDVVALMERLRTAGVEHVLLLTARDDV